MKEQKPEERFDPLLHGYLDDELDSQGREHAAKRLESNPEIQRMADDFKQLGQWARKACQPPHPLPTADAFWLQLRDRLPEKLPLGARLAGLLSGWVLKPRFGMAVLGVFVCAALIWSIWLAPGSKPANMGPAFAESDSVVESLETEVADASFMVYHSESENLTVVWLLTDNGVGSESEEASSGIERQI